MVYYEKWLAAEALISVVSAKQSTDAMVKDIAIIAGIFLGLWILWYATGGVERFERSNRGAFVKPPSPIDTGETYGEFPKWKNATSTN